MSGMCYEGRRERGGRQREKERVHERGRERERRLYFTYSQFAVFIDSNIARLQVAVDDSSRVDILKVNIIVTSEILTNYSSTYHNDNTLVQKLSTQ